MEWLKSLFEGVGMADWIKALKDGALGLIPMGIGAFIPQAGGSMQIWLFVAGAIVMILGVTSNTIAKDWTPMTTWGKVAKDTILAFCSSAMPIIQNGAGNGTEAIVIIGTLVTAGFSVFLNVVQADITTTTLFGKIAKDFFVVGMGVVYPIFTGALAAHQPIMIALGAAGTALLTVAGNVIKKNLTA